MIDKTLVAGNGVDWLLPFYVVRSGKPVKALGARSEISGGKIQFSNVLELSAKTLRNICDHVWSVEELIALLLKPQAKKRGPYKKRAA